MRMNFQNTICKLKYNPKHSRWGYENFLKRTVSVEMDFTFPGKYSIALDTVLQGNSISYTHYCLVLISYFEDW